MQTSVFKKRTVVAYEVDESGGGTVLNVLRIFHGGQDWEAAIEQIEGDPDTNV